MRHSATLKCIVGWKVDVFLLIVLFLGLAKVFFTQKFRLNSHLQFGEILHINREHNATKIHMLHEYNYGEPF